MTDAGALGFLRHETGAFEQALYLKRKAFSARVPLFEYGNLCRDYGDFCAHCKKKCAAAYGRYCLERIQQFGEQ